MSTEGTDSGYLSNWMPADTLQQCGVSTISTDECWSLVTRREGQWQLDSAAQQDCEEFELEDVEAENVHSTLEARRIGNGYSSTQGLHMDAASKFNHPVVSTDVQESVPRLRKPLVQEYYDARTQLQIALQRDADSRKRSFASMQQLSTALADDRSTDRSTIEALRKQCMDDSIDLSKRQSEVTKAQEAFQLILDRLTDHGSSLSFEYTRRSSIGLPTRDDDEMSDHSDASSKAPAVLERYFELAGQENVVDERLNELDAEHEEALVKCMEQHVQSSSQMQIPCCEETEEYQLKRRDLLEARGFARRQLQIQRDICLSSGINPERYRYRRISVRERKDFFGRDLLSGSHKSNPKLVHDSVTDWLQQGTSTW